MNAVRRRGNRFLDHSSSLTVQRFPAGGFFSILLEQRRGIGRFRIGQRSLRDMGKGREEVRGGFLERHDMPDVPAMGHQRIGNQRPMAAPRHRFRAHDGSLVLAAISYQRFNGSVKFFRLHIVGVPAKTGVAPSVVDRILPSLSKAPKRGHVERVETGIFQALGQSVRIELRVVS